MASINVEHSYGTPSQIVLHVDLEPADETPEGRNETMGRASVIFEFELARRPKLTYGEYLSFDFYDNFGRHWPRPTLSHKIQVETKRLLVDQEVGILAFAIDQVVEAARRGFGSALPDLAKLAKVNLSIDVVEGPFLDSQRKTAWQHLLEDEASCPKP